MVKTKERLKGRKKRKTGLHESNGHKALHNNVTRYEKGRLRERYGIASRKIYLT